MLGPILHVGRSIRRRHFDRQVLESRFQQCLQPTALVVMFVASLHFGTKHTSVACAHSDSPGEVEFVQNWPNGSPLLSSSNRVPTEVAYEGESIRWGYEVSNSRSCAEPVVCLNLLLEQPCADPQSAAADEALQATPLPVSTDSKTSCSDSDNRESQAGGPEELSGDRQLPRTLDLSAATASSRATPLSCVLEPSPFTTQLRRSRKILEERHISALTAVADFLSKVRETTLDSLERSYETKSVQWSGVKWIIAVPARWDDSAKERMAQATRQAGFGVRGIDFEFVSEPECVAAFMLKPILSCLTSGDAFVVCDAGDETVDVLTYRISGLDPLCVIEVVAQTGSRCGGALLDTRFEEYIRRIVGDSFIDGMSTRPKAEMMRTWEERVKFKFGKTSNEFEVHIPGAPDDPAKNIEESFHIMEAEDVKEIFDPVVDRIVDLVSTQVREVEGKGDVVKVIVLAGCFSASDYLLKSLKDYKYVEGGIAVLQTISARSAVTFGGLLRGMESDILMGKFSSRHLGSYYHERSTADNNLLEVVIDAKRCPDETSWLATDKMDWYVQKHALLKLPGVNFYRVVPVRSDQEPDFLFRIPLYTCDDEDAPARRWQNTSAVHRLCTLTLDLRGIPREKLTIVRNLKGEPAYYVPFQLRISEFDKVLKFEPMFDGTGYGIVDVQCA